MKQGVVTLSKITAENINVNIEMARQLIHSKNYVDAKQLFKYIAGSDYFRKICQDKDILNLVYDGLGNCLYKEGDYEQGLFYLNLIYQPTLTQLLVMGDCAVKFGNLDKVYKLLDIINEKPKSQTNKLKNKITKLTDARDELLAQQYRWQRQPTYTPHANATTPSTFNLDSLEDFPRLPSRLKPQRAL